MCPAYVLVGAESEARCCSVTALREHYPELTVREWEQGSPDAASLLSQ